MGFLYWETCACLINFEKEKVDEKVFTPDFHAYYQSGGISKNPKSLQSAERIDPSALCRVWAFCLARTRFLCKEISFLHKPLKGNLKWQFQQMAFSWSVSLVQLSTNN